MFLKSRYKKIYSEIKKYDIIVIARHVGPDPDALGSSIGLRDSISLTFPNKTVVAVGCPTNRFKYMGTLNEMEEKYYENSLLIVTDTPNKNRIDGVEVDRFKSVIKIDHHPFIEDFGGVVDWSDDSRSSASEMIIEIIKETKLKINKEIASKLYLGLVADTERFLFSYTSPQTFRLVGWLIEESKIDIDKLYPLLYNRPLKELKFQAYILNNYVVTKNGLAFIKISDEILKEFDVDVAIGGNLVNSFNFIKEFIVWVIFTEDKLNEITRVNIRSNGPVINDIASLFGGGGHKFASGAKLRNPETIDEMVEALDEACKEYKTKQE